MDQPQSSNLLEGLHAVPDPRHARGKQLEWTFLWGVIASALLSNHRTPAAIAQWAKQQAAPLLTALQPRRGRVPSETTIRRTLRQVDIVALEAQLAGRAPPPSPPAASVPLPRSPAPPLQGQALDGKYLRGVGAHGQPLQLVSLVEHGSGRVGAQTAVAPQAHESRAAPEVLPSATWLGSS